MQSYLKETFRSNHRHENISAKFTTTVTDLKRDFSKLIIKKALHLSMPGLYLTGFQ